MLLLQEALVLVELLVESLQRRRIPREPALSVLLEHPPEAVDRRVEVVDLHPAARELLRDGVPLARALVVALGELRGRDRQLPHLRLERAPLRAGLRDLAREIARLLGVEALREDDAHLRDAVDQRERLLFAGMELGERPNAVRRVEDDVELVDEKVALTDERLALVDVINDRERHRAVLGLARPAHCRRRQLLVLIEHVELLLRELVVVDGRIGRLLDEGLELLAHRLVFLADAEIELERLVEGAGAEEEVRTEERCVTRLGRARIGDLEDLERALGALHVTEANVHPRELVEHRAELGGVATDLRVGLRRLGVVLHLVLEAPDGHPGQVDDLTVLRRVGRELGRELERLDRGLVVRPHTAQRLVRRRPRRCGRRRRRRCRLHRHHALEVAGLMRVRAPVRHGLEGGRRLRIVALEVVRLALRVREARVHLGGRHLVELGEDLVEAAQIVDAEADVDEARERATEVRTEARLVPTIDDLAVIAARGEVLLLRVEGLAAEPQSVDVRRRVRELFEDLAEDDRRARVVLRAVEELAVRQALLHRVALALRLLDRRLNGAGLVRNCVDLALRLRAVGVAVRRESDPGRHGHTDRKPDGDPPSEASSLGVKEPPQHVYFPPPS